MIGSAAAQQTATLVWRGESYPVAVNGDLFSAGDAARALGLSVSRDTTTGVLTIGANGHEVVVGPASSLPMVDGKTVEISKPSRAVGGVLYVPMDFFAKTLFPILGASGVYDSASRVWTVNERGGRPPAPEADTAAPISLDISVVYVGPTTQVVFRESGPARFTPSISDSGMQIQWLDRRIAAPFAERRFDDPMVAAIRFEGNSATVVFREPGLTAHAYPLTGPDRIVVEVGRAVEAPPIAPAPPPPPAIPAITVVVDPGHGGAETGAVGPAGLQEKEVTLQIARRLAAAIPRVVSSRVVLTRNSDSAISLDDRTSLANHEKASLFLSLHANSSRAAGAHGSETYYLSLDTNDRLAQEVAQRENLSGGPGDPGSGTGVEPASPDLDFILWDLAQSAHLNESSRLAEAIQTQLNVVSKTENRGIKQAPFRVLSGAAMPAVLVEIGFISHPEQEKQLKSAAFQQSVADAIAKAVGEFFARRQTVAPASGPTPAATPAPAR
jgi:N-acetylmuramoyl-L-alanine amidase